MLFNPQGMLASVCQHWYPGTKAQASQTHSRTHRMPEGYLLLPKSSGFSESLHTEHQNPTNGTHTFLSNLCGCCWSIKSCCQKVYTAFNSLSEPLFLFL